METILRTILRRSGTDAFRRSFALILVAEAVTICIAWLLLGFNSSRWIHERSAQAVRLARSVAGSADWSLAGTVPKGRGSVLFDHYHARLKSLSQGYFAHNEGDVALKIIDRGEEYAIDPDDPYPMDDLGKANPWELQAYATGETTHNPTPYSDDTGTYLAAYRPILRDGKVVALLEAEYDSATLSDFRAIVRQAFWLSILPAIALALGAAYLLTGMLVPPMEIFRRIDETAAAGAGRDGPLSRLSPRESEVAELVRRGLKNKEIAEALVLSPETVKAHLKSIREKTGFTKVDLAVHAEAARSPSAQSGGPPA